MDLWMDYPPCFFLALAAGSAAPVSFLWFEGAACVVSRHALRIGRPFLERV